MLPSIPLWQREHGISFAVPAIITEDPELIDISWKNDVSPSFILKAHEPRLHQESGTEFRLWVDHPVQAERELDNDYRYSVWNHTDQACLYTGNDVRAAIRVLKAQKDTP